MHINTIKAHLFDNEMITPEEYAKLQGQNPQDIPKQIVFMKDDDTTMLYSDTIEMKNHLIDLDISGLLNDHAELKSFSVMTPPGARAMIAKQSDTRIRLWCSKTTQLRYFLIIGEKTQHEIAIVAKGA